jgi:hypothetical protein
MEVLSTVLPIVIDCLLCCLLVAIIVLIIKVIGIIDDARLLIDNIIDKVNTVNGLFKVIKRIDTGINGVAKRIVDIIERAINKLPSNNKTSDEEIELEEILKGKR